MASSPSSDASPLQGDRGGGDDFNAMEDGNQTNIMIELEPCWTSPKTDDDALGSGGQGEEKTLEGGLPETCSPLELPKQELQRLDLALKLQGGTMLTILQSDSFSILLDTSIILGREGSANLNEECQKFCCETLPTVFSKVLTSPNLPSWKRETQLLIRERSDQVLELIVLGMKTDGGQPCLATAKLLGVLFNPNTLFHIHNFSQKANNVTSFSERTEEQFAKSTDAGESKGWLVDFINRFGQLGGFQALTEKLSGLSASGISHSQALPLFASLLRPWEYCCVYLNMDTLEPYFLQFMQSTLLFLSKYQEFESNTKNKSSCNSIFQSLKRFLSVLPGTDIDSRIKIRSQITESEDKIGKWMEGSSPSTTASDSGSLQRHTVDIHALAMEGGLGLSAVRTIVVDSSMAGEGRSAAVAGTASLPGECRVIVEDGSSSLGSAGGLERQESSNADVCRVCFEGELTSKNRLIQPCNCAGSQAYIHQRCLVKWIRISQNRNCEICFSHFRHIPLSEKVHSCMGELRRNKRWRNAAFATLVGLIVILYLVIFAVFPGGLIQD